MTTTNQPFNYRHLFTLNVNLPPLPEGYPISAKVIQDSTWIEHRTKEEGGIEQYPHRLITFELEYPRFIHSELMTHRVLSRNASSTRAIPTAKLAEIARQNPVYPVRFGVNRGGMQAAQENLQEEDLRNAYNAWEKMMDTCVDGCTTLSKLKLHKQWAGRPLEWFTPIRVVVTVEEQDLHGMFHLRDHSDAQDEFIYLAQAMKNAANESISRAVVVKGEDWGEKDAMRNAYHNKHVLWHLPYVSVDDQASLPVSDCLKVSAARCARVSYKTFHGVKSTLEEDIQLYKSLVPEGGALESDPFHASPTEHQAIPFFCADNFSFYPIRKVHPLVSNFKDWVQNRRLIELSMI